MNKVLYQAIKNQNVLEVKDVISSLINLSKKNDFYHIDEIINYKDDRGRDCLQMAFNSKNEEIIKSIINFKLENYDNWFNKQSLIRAINVGSSELIKQVLSYDININQVNQRGENALMLAIKFNKNEAIELLLASKININHLDSKGNNALYFALDHKNSDKLISKLNNQGIDFTQKLHGKERLEQEVNVFLMLAYREKSLNLFKHIIKENEITNRTFSLNSLDEIGNNALLLSIFYAHVDKQETFKYIYENIKEIDLYHKNEFGSGIMSVILHDRLDTHSLRKPLLEYLIEKQYVMSKDFDLNEWEKVKRNVTSQELLGKIEEQIKTFQEKSLLESSIQELSFPKKSLKL